MSGICIFVEICQPKLPWSARSSLVQHRGPLRLVEIYRSTIVFPSITALLLRNVEKCAAAGGLRFPSIVCMPSNRWWQFVESINQIIGYFFLGLICK
jgi:hypothetical protein